MCSKTVEAVFNALSSSALLADAKVIKDFPGIKQDMPLQIPVVSVGLKGATVLSGDETPTLSKDNANGTVEVKISICSPKGKAGSEIINLLDRVLSALSSVLSNVKAQIVDIEEIKYSSTLGCLLIPLSLKITNIKPFS